MSFKPRDQHRKSFIVQSFIHSFQFALPHYNNTLKSSSLSMFKLERILNHEILKYHYLLKQTIFFNLEFGARIKHHAMKFDLLYGLH